MPTNNKIVSVVLGKDIYDDVVKKKGLISMSNLIRELIRLWLSGEIVIR